jgi:hypothetical protein
MKTSTGIAGLFALSLAASVASSNHAWAQSEQDHGRITWVMRQRRPCRISPHPAWPVPRIPTFVNVT